ncbi:hypothetical protein CARUB_v10022462mg, partial [Capsella rubella]
FETSERRMRIDFAEPECRDCYHCRTAGVLNTQESELHSVIGSSFASVPIGPGTLQEALGHVVVSTSSSSPTIFGSAPAATPSVNCGPEQSVDPKQRSFGSPSQGPAFQAPILATSSGSGASGASASATSSPDHSSSVFKLGSAPAATTSVSSGPTPTLAPPIFATESIFKAPVQDPFQSGASFSFPTVHSFGKPAFARPDVGISPVTSFSNTTTGVFGATTGIFGQTQAPVQASTSTSPPFGCNPGALGSGSSPFTSAFGYQPASSYPARQNTSTGFGTPTGSFCSQFGSKSGVNCSGFPGFGVGYSPGSSSNLLSPNPPNFGGGSIGAGPQSFGVLGATTMSPSSPLSSPSLFSTHPNIGFNPSASHEWSYGTKQGSRTPAYAPTHDGQNKSAWGLHTEKGDTFISISASKPYQHKSHEELRWEDYKQGDKGGVFPGAHTYPIGSRPIAAPTGFFPGITPSFTTVPSINSSVQRPHETATFPPPPSPRCTACGATSSSSASGHFTFNGATTPPSAATTPPGMFFPATGFGPMMFGATPSVQGATPALQAYPVQGYIVLPFAAMSLQ